MEYKTCIADTDKALIELSKIAGLSFTKGDFAHFEDKFVDSGKSDELYVLNNSVLKVTVHLEKYEGYFFISIQGDGDTFDLAKAYLVECG